MDTQQDQRNERDIAIAYLKRHPEVILDVPEIYYAWVQGYMKCPVGGSASSITAHNGNLLIAIGSRFAIKRFDGDYVHGLNMVKYMIRKAGVDTEARAARFREQFPFDPVPDFYGFIERGEWPGIFSRLREYADYCGINIADLCDDAMYSDAEE